MTYSCGILEGIVSSKSKIDRVRKANPFLIREEVAEAAEPVGDRLIRTHGLRGVGVLNRPVEAVDHVLETGRGVGEVVRDPNLGRLIAAVLLAGVGAVKIAGERVVGPILLDDDFDGGVPGPLETEEAREPVLGGLEHPVLRLQVR